MTGGRTDATVKEAEPSADRRVTPLEGTRQTTGLSEQSKQNETGSERPRMDTQGVGSAVAWRRRDRLAAAFVDST